MAGVRSPSRRTSRLQLALPGSLLAIAALGTLTLFFHGASAGGQTVSTRVSGTHLTSKSCGTVNIKGVSPVANSGDPFTSSQLKCQHGKIVSYGNGAITYSNPPPSYIAAGRLLFAQTCSSCHGNEANGVDPSGHATIGPNLQGVGAATVDFWVSTGRMPAADIDAYGPVFLQRAGDGHGAGRQVKWGQV